MKFCRLALYLALLMTPGLAAAQAKSPRQDDRVFALDKVKHFFIAGFIESMAFAGTQAAGGNRATARTAAIGVTAAASIGREIHDRRTKGFFSVRDLAWDAIGAAAAMLVLHRTQK